MKLRPGDVIYAEKARYAGRVAVLASAHRKGGMRVDGPHRTSRSGDADGARLRRAAARARQGSSCPTDYAPNRHDFQKEVVHRLELGHPRAALDARPGRDRRGVARPDRIRSRTIPELERSPEGGGAGRAGGPRVEELRTRVRDRSQSVARDFDRVLRVLENWGYVDGWSADRRRQDPGQDVSRVRPADRRMPAPRAARRPRSGGAGRPGVGLRLRAPQPRAAADCVVPVADRAQAVAADRRDQLRARGDRRGSRPDGAPPARPDVRRPLPTRGPRARASPRSSRPRSCPAATSCAR